VTKIGDGTHRRGIVNVREFERRFGVKQLAVRKIRKWSGLATSQDDGCAAC
jgi:hypothetical protein